jgi:enterochelin esterase family protein
VHVLLTGVLALALLQPARPEAVSYPSRIFGGQRQVFVYTPAGSQAPSTGLVIFLWGHDYLDQIAAPATLDALSRDGRLRRVTAVFLDDADARYQDFQTTQRAARSIAGELIPWLRSSGRTQADAAHTAVVGYSAAGLGAGYTVFAHPDVIGTVVAQSGAFWRGFDGDGGSSPEWLRAQFAAIPLRTTRFVLEVGGAETREAGGSGVSILDANRHLHDVLVAKGYPVAYTEVPGAQHEYGHWRAALPDALAAMAKW